MGTNNEFYDRFIEGNIDETILDVKLGGKKFEDHFWHLACVSLYYQNKHDDFSEKTCLRRLCDLNYAYSAMLYFKKYNCLPKNYDCYLDTFTNSMKNDKLEERIKHFNNSNKSSNFKDALLYSLATLVVIPLMFILVFLFKMETDTAVIVSIAFLIGFDMFLLPLIREKKRKKALKENLRDVDKRLENYLKYYDRFAKLFQNEDYINLIKAKKEEKRIEIANKIIEGMK